ncbi:MAG: hypothetical protein HYT07_00490 [Candidatus Levybacteria bacterium]|nr:hypothetical protein [Candidatus Levybacteria bacterium]
MPFSDLLYIFQWWLIIFIIGIIFLPLTGIIFHSLSDRGYIFSKIIGIALLSYVIFILGILRIQPFTVLTILLTIVGFLILNIFLVFKYSNLIKSLGYFFRIFVFEEIIFLSVLIFWSYIHAHGPDIHGLEKYMDFGFINSILRSEYFPPSDMWLTPLYINYYYFGHLTTAVLTKLSSLPPNITYNLMLAAISGFTFAGAFSIGANLIFLLKSKLGFRVFIGGLLSALLITFAGNLHSVYTFFKPYENESPVPFWQLIFSLDKFPNSYWYPNATRFIENTIHEFPIYSFVVSDLHGHVLDIPFVLLTITILLSLVLKSQITNHKSQISSNFQSSKRFDNYSFGYLNLFRISNFGFRILLLGFILAIMYMTNAWDGLIYLLLTAIVIFTVQLRSTTNSSNPKRIKYYVLSILFLVFGFFLFSLPFNLNFKPFASGIGILCAPEFLTKIERLGPFLFEKDHCQRSPIWQLFILYGFFYFWAIVFILLRFNFKNKIQKLKSFNCLNFIKNFKFKIENLSPSGLFISVLIFFSTLLIIIPEFIYVKDIYPAHYRANTMFKLVYQAFIMLSLSSGYTIIRLFVNRKFIHWKFVYWVIGSIGLFLVFVYPYFAINSYFGDLKTYHGLDGTKYLKSLYPTDYEAILWINKNIKGQPVILEAQGDSYTDYGRVSTNTGLPTVLGWSVHEWLWRGTYDIPSPRIEEVQTLYETVDSQIAKKLIDKYKISLVFVGDLEKQKYTLSEEKFSKLGQIVYSSDQTKIYKIN